MSMGPCGLLTAVGLRRRRLFSKDKRIRGNLEMICLR